MDRKPRFGGSHGYDAGSLETFRTVSLRGWVNKGKKKKGRV